VQNKDAKKLFKVYYEQITEMYNQNYAIILDSLKVTKQDNESNAMTFKHIESLNTFEIEPIVLYN